MTTLEIRNGAPGFAATRDHVSGRGPPRDTRGIAATPTLLFFHIGKTGGTSLTRYFQALARTSHVQAFPEDYSRLEDPDGTEPRDFISGHYKVDSWLRRVPSTWRTMVVIRNPVQHLLSSYWHIRTHPRVPEDAGLCELIDATNRADLGCLLQLRRGQSHEMHFDNPQARFILNKSSGPLHAGDMTRALALLDSLDHVGITERLEAFATHVAASMPWAAGWENQPLPRAMVNPLNVMCTDEIPRGLLRDILAATEIDAELHERARMLQLELESLAPANAFSRLPAKDAPVPATRVIPIVDVIRVLPITTQNVRVGDELYIDGDEILLHPPATGKALVAMDGIPFDGHSEMSGRLLVAHEHAAPVLFSLELSRDTTILASASFKIAPGQPLDVLLRFPATTGSARLTLRTEMADGNPNNFAWAKFLRLSIA